MNNPFKIWLMAIRPKTLPAAIAPVFMATMMAFGDGVEHLPTALLCLAGALLIQIGTNLVNDYADFKKGADTSERLGPPRVMQSGLVAPKVMLSVIVITFLLVALIGWVLYERGGTPIAIIAVASILSGILYTAGPWPLGYLGLGDIFVLIFFGPVAVAGTYYVQSLEMNLAVILSGIAPGLLSMAILIVNNLRDIAVDRNAGKKTLAVRFGRSFAMKEYLFGVLTASLMPVLIYCLIEDHLAIMFASLISIAAIPTIQTVLTQEGRALNHALEDTGKLLLVYSVLFAIGWVL